jgi:hypothetical protein
MTGGFMDACVRVMAAAVMLLIIYSEMGMSTRGILRNVVISLCLSVCFSLCLGALLGYNSVALIVKG